MRQKFLLWLGPVISTSDPQMSHDFFWIVCAVFSTQNVDWWNTTGFTAEAFFSATKSLVQVPTGVCTNIWVVQLEANG